MDSRVIEEMFCLIVLCMSFSLKARRLKRPPVCRGVISLVKGKDFTSRRQ